MIMIQDERVQSRKKSYHKHFYINNKEDMALFSSLLHIIYHFPTYVALYNINPFSNPLFKIEGWLYWVLGIYAGG